VRRPIVYVRARSRLCAGISCQAAAQRPGAWRPVEVRQGARVASPSPAAGGRPVSSVDERKTSTPGAGGCAAPAERTRRIMAVSRYSMELGGRTLTLETGRMAGPAGGAVMVTYGETVVLACATSSE